MKITLRELIRIDAALGKILHAPLPIKIAFKLRRVVRLLRDDISVLEETRRALISKYSEDQGNGRFKFYEDTREEFENEYSILMDQEIEFDFEPISIEDLQGVSLSATEALDLEKFIVE